MTDDFTWSTVGGLPLLLDDGDHTYLYGPSLTPVAQVDGSGTVQYLHGDLLGSVRTITDASGAVVGASTFDAFGSRTAHTGTGDSLFGFTGNWTDPDTQLVHLRARDYDPGTGQFLSVDPVVDATRQPYAYTGNSPLQRTDPSGLDWIQDAYDGAVDALMAAAQASNCFLEQATAFGAGALDSLTMGASSIILGAVVPGYDDFVAGHEAAFTAGSIAATVIQAALIIIGTAGAGAGLAVGLLVLKNVVKSAVKSVVKSIERGASRVIRGLADEAGSVNFFAAAGRSSSGGLFRGAKNGEMPSFAPRPNEFKVDPETGLVRETHGVSVFDNPASVAGRGLHPHAVDPASIPRELQVLQRGVDPHHYEIAPAPGANLTPEAFIACLLQIRCG